MVTTRMAHDADVAAVRVVDGMIAEFTTFGPQLFAQFGLAATLSSRPSR